jgi:sec-independent protein translocase protein TatA
MGEGLFSPTHMIIVLLIVFFLFGAKKLPELGKSMGTGIREFRNGISELHADADDETVVAAAPAAGSAPASEAGPAPASVERTDAPAE